MQRYTYICCNSDIDLFDPLHDIEISVIADSEYDAVNMVRQELAKICKVNGITDNYGMYNGDVSDIADTQDQPSEYFLEPVTLENYYRHYNGKRYAYKGIVYDNATLSYSDRYNLKLGSEICKLEISGDTEILLSDLA